MIAQELAVEAPDRVEKLVLCCTTPGGAGRLPAPRGDDEALRRGADAGARSRPAPLRRERARREPAGGLVDDLFARRVANPPDPDGWQAQAAAGTTFGGVEGVDRRAPTLILQGTEDNVVDARNAELLAQRIPGARVELIPGTGHLFFWEQPETFLDPSSTGSSREPAYDRPLAARPRPHHARPGRRRFRGEPDDLRGARRPLRRARSVALPRGRRLDPDRQLGGAHRTLLRVRESRRDPASDLVAPRPRRGRLPARRRRPDVFVVEDEQRELAEAALALASVAPAPTLSAGAEHRATGLRTRTGCCSIYTSGTTGKPKGALLTHANCFWTNVSFDLATGIGGDDVAAGAAAVPRRRLERAAPALVVEGRAHHPRAGLRPEPRAAADRGEAGDDA